MICETFIVIRNETTPPGSSGRGGAELYIPMEPIYSNQNRKVGNISKCKDELVVNTLFNKQQRKFRKHRCRKRGKVNLQNLTTRLESLLQNYKYKSYTFCFNVRSLILSLPRKSMLAVWNVVQNWLSLHNTPDRTVILLKDLIAFRKKASCIVSSAVTKRSEAASGFMKVYYHNKGIEMLHLPKILNSKIVKDNVHMFRKPPMVSYTYTNIVSDWKEEWWRSWILI